MVEDEGNAEGLVREGGDGAEVGEKVEGIDWGGDQGREEARIGRDVGRRQRERGRERKGVSEDR